MEESHPASAEQGSEELDEHQSAERHSLTRREMIIEGVNHCEAMPLYATAAYFAYQVLIEPKLKADVTVDDFKGIGKGILINQEHSLEGGGSFRNLGVAHTRYVYRQNQALFEKAVDRCDVLLTENDGDSAFFGPINKYALTAGKRVVMVDNFNQWILMFAVSGFPVLTGAMLSTEQMDNLDRKLKHGENLRIFSTRRNFLRVIAATVTGLQISTGIYSTYNPLEDDVAEDRGYLSRGRSASMFKYAQSVMTEDAGKNYFLLTGGGHALMFEHYQAHPAQLEQDLKDYAFQRTLFGEGKHEVT